MPNLRIISDNAIDRATLTSQDTATNFSVASLQAARKSDVWRSVMSTGASLRATWASPESLQAVVLPLCNLSPTATMRVRATGEGQTTNMFADSSAVIAGTTSNGDTGSIDDYGVAPDGTTTSAKISSGTRYLNSYALVVGNTYTYSEFVKSAGGSGASLYKDGGGTIASAQFTFATGLISSPSGVTSTNVQVLSGGWYRISMTFVATATAGTFHYFPGGGGVEFWGAQLEPGGLTSYYPTSGSSATRPLGYIDGWQSYTYDSGAVLACPAPAVSIRGFTAAQAASAYAFGGGATARHWMPSAVQAYGLAIDIVDASNTAGYIEASYLVAGTYWETATNFDYGASAQLVDSTKNTRNDAGDLISDAGTVSNRLSIPFSKLSATDRAALWGILRAGGMRYPSFISMFPGSSDLALERDHQVYGKLVQLPAMALPYFNLASATIEVESV